MEDVMSSWTGVAFHNGSTVNLGNVTFHFTGMSQGDLTVAVTGAGDFHNATSINEDPVAVSILGNRYEFTNLPQTLDFGDGDHVLQRVGGWVYDTGRYWVNYNTR